MVKVSKFQIESDKYINLVKYEDYKVSFEYEGYIYIIDGQRYIVIEIEDMEKEYPYDNTFVFILNNNNTISPFSDLEISKKVMKLYNKDLDLED